ncbi:MAG: GNAT family N-acetyltransferase [Planctomycetota bacterium]|nr:MAG: GNAT family N-acetyltransferase [Planctomycetota bacterium]
MSKRPAAPHPGDDPRKAKGKAKTKPAAKIKPSAKVKPAVKVKPDAKLAASSAGKADGKQQRKKTPPPLRERVKTALRTRSLVIRPLRASDYSQIVSIQQACFPDIEPWGESQFHGHLDIFPEGQIGIEVDGVLVATSSSLIVERSSLPPTHSFIEACADGDLTNHNPEGDTLYGIDIAVLPRHRGKRLARRLYDARKQLARDRNLRSMIIAGRIPNYHKHAKRLSPEEYLKQVMDRKIRDPVITAQTANGFVPCHIIRGYLPTDRESMGNALLMEWFNPDYVARRPGRKRIIDDVRIASVQYEMRPVRSFADFAGQVEFFVDTASEYRCDFICLPELLTNQLLSITPKARNPIDTARSLSVYTQEYINLFAGLSVQYNINIIGGSHLQVEGDHLYNVAYLFRRDGSIATQRKIHITPSEARWWGVQPGNDVEVFDTDCGPIAILICYDIEFPELARIVRSKGARIIFVPFNTDIRPSYLRVRNCAAARCIENNVYCVLSGPVGNLPLVDGADIHYAQAAILTPNDIPFSRDGIGAECAPNTETMCIHEVDMSLLRHSLYEGSVRTWLDRRHDLYQIHLHGKPLAEDS